MQEATAFKTISCTKNFKKSKQDISQNNDVQLVRIYTHMIINERI